MISRRELVLAGLLAATPGPTNADALAGVAGVGPSLYLRELAELQSRLSADATDLANRQQLAQVLAMTGDQRAADAVWMGPRRMAQSTGSRIAATALANTFAEDAVSAIEREARKSRIVILNEAHHVSRCRAFGEVIALRLRRLGFNRLALEALALHPQLGAGSKRKRAA